jgi:hypothetical protein
MAASGPACVKTQAFNLRVESFSRFRQSKEEYRCGCDRKKVNRENNALHCWLVSVFTQPRASSPIRRVVSHRLQSGDCVEKLARRAAAGNI